MSLLKIVWSNIWQNKLNSLLNFLLCSSGIAVISVLINLNAQLERQLNDNMNGIDMVIGAKGSPMQIVLSAVYHIDFPTGNIPYSEFAKLQRNPMVKQAIPLSIGDNYNNFRIVGTNQKYFELYGAELASGNFFTADLQVCIGADVARNLKLKLNDEISSTHGLTEEGDHHEHGFTICGILKPTGKVIDRLVVCNLNSYWQMHHLQVNPNDSSDPREITNILIQYRNPIAAINLPRLIQKTGNLQAASPAMELNKLFSMMGFGFNTLRLIAYLITALALLGILFSMLNALKERKHQLAMMRVMGGTRLQLAVIIICESVMITLSGCIAGVIFSRVMLYLLNTYISSEYNYSLNLLGFEGAELWLIALSIATGLIAALWPAIIVYRQHISLTLRNK